MGNKGVLCGKFYIYRMFRIAWLVNLWSNLPCNDYITTLCEIKQVVREWAEFSYKAMFIHAAICQADFEK